MSCTDLFISSRNSRKKMLSAFVMCFLLSITCPVLGADILFITGARLFESDLIIQDNLENRGFEVTVVPDHEVQVADALEKDLVVISESVYSLKLNTTLRNLPVPVIVSEPGLFGDMGMTGSNPFVDYGKARRQSDIAINDLSHNLTAGLSAGAVSISYRNTAIGWGVPGANAIKIATLNDNPAKCTLFAYDKDDEMPGLKAPAKRVGIFLYRKTAAYLTEEGWALFQAAVDWTLAPQPPKQININIVSDDTWNACAGNDCPDAKQYQPSCNGVSNSTTPDEVITGTDADFIWPCPPEDGLPPSEAYFHRSFNISGDPANVRVKMDYISVPGQLRVYVNGSLAIAGGTMGEGGSMKRPIGIRRYLIPGENEITIYADNRNAAERWVLLDVRLEALIEPPNETPAKQALLVVGRTPLRFSDRQLKMRLERLGYLVYLIDDDRVEEVDSESKDLIVISESVRSAMIGETFSRVGVPLICFESYLYDDLNMTGPRPNRDYGKAYRQNHIDYKGFPGGKPVAITPDKIKTTNRRSSVGWGVPLGSALIVATLLNNPDRAAIFAYEKDAAMADGQPAPARRVGMFLHRNTSKCFTKQGWELFDAAVQWATTGQ